MGETEEYFPRGGKKPTTTYFKQSGNFLGAPEKGEKKKKRPKKKSETDDGYLSDEAAKDVDQSFKNCAFGIYYNTIKPGVQILGRVQRVQETKVSVMLPSRMTGTVMACHISETYTKELEAYVNDQLEKVIELSRMFRPGQFVALKVLEVCKQSLMLSMMPQHINSGKTQADLHNGALLQVAISSVEDHGYVIDLGIPNTRAFLPKAQSNPELELGMVTWCVVKSSGTEGGVVTLSNTLQALQTSVQRKKTTTLLPATAVEFTVDKPLDNGIEGQVFGDMTAYIQRYHADTVKGKKPNLGQRIRARVLYVMPIKNTPYLTMKNIFEATYPNLEEEQKLKEGDIVEEAQVLKITGKSIHFKLGKGSLGVMSLRRIQIDEDLNDEEVVAKSYPIGSAHKVRVLCYNMSDYMYSVTDESSVISEKYFSVAQLAVGDVVTATVKTVEATRLILQIGRFTGVVPQSHVSDAGVYVDPKAVGTTKLLKKFKVGQEVRARVLLLDVSKSGVYLTMKPTLLSPDLPVLAGYEQAVVGKAYTGTIKYIRDYILVVFFNNVIAFVPPAKDVPAQTYHIGQIVNCTIMRVDVNNKKMTGSLTTAPFWPAIKPDKPKKRTIDSDNKEVMAKKFKAEAENVDSKNKKKEKVKYSDEQMKEKITTTSEETDAIETDLQENNVIKKKKKEKSLKSKKELDTSELEEGNEMDLNEETIVNKKKKKGKKKEIVLNGEIKSNLQDKIEGSKKKKKKDKQSVNEDEIKLEESDEINKSVTEDIQETEILMPQDLHLIDLSDCVTCKNYKKRVVSLIKAVNARTHRMNRIDKKIENIEIEGLNSRNKIYHTAMHTEKITLEERIKKLLEALMIAQEKLKEFDLKPNKEYKKKKNSKEIVVNKDVEKENVQHIDVKVLDSLKPALDVPSAKDFWSDYNDSSKTVQDEELSSSEDEEKEQPKKKRKKLTIAEKVAKVREEEEKVRQMEQRAVESESQPRSSEQFERALLASPDCSQLWIAYMAFHLQSTEIEKARAVGRKAIKAISFREEDEKLNVWLAMINCENRFGTKESQQKIVEEALQMNEPFKVHSKLLDIYVETSKPQEVLALVDLMMRKYKRDPNTYIMCGGACFKLGLIEKARQVMQKAVATLEKKEHVQILVQFALMERSMGERERAEALFEQILAVYPQRVDVCSTYIDMLTKTGDIEQVRQVMDRMTAHKLPARKMKILYKKWVDVEEKYGSSQEVERIQNLALEYVKKAKF